MRGLLLAAALAVIHSSGAWAAASGGISISPVRVDLAPGRSAQALTVTNTGDHRRTIEVEVLRWSQEDGEDRYQPTREVLANPPLFFIEPGAQQTVRIGRPRSGPALSGEAAYRVYFREVPSADESPVNGLQFALNIGVPVFVTTGPMSAPQLDWSLVRNEQGDLRLRANNQGTTHARLADVRIKDASGGEWAVDGFRYVLAGQWQEWVLPSEQAPAAEPQSLTALTETGRVEYKLAAIPR